MSYLITFSLTQNLFLDTKIVCSVEFEMFPLSLDVVGQRLWCLNHGMTSKKILQRNRWNPCMKETWSQEIRKFKNTKKNVLTIVNLRDAQSNIDRGEERA